jgi:hypothetical protein
MEDNIWEKHAKRHRRQEEFAHIDAWLEQLYRRRPFMFNLFCLGLSAIFFVIVFCFTTLLDWIARKV